MVMHATSDLNHTQERHIAVYVWEGSDLMHIGKGGCFSTIFGIMLTYFLFLLFIRWIEVAHRHKKVFTVCCTVSCH